MVARAAGDGVGLDLDGQSLRYYDGPAFVGLPRGRLGAHGAAVRAEELVLTERILADAYGAQTPPYLDSAEPLWTGDYPGEFRSLTPTRAGYVHRAAGANPLLEPSGWFSQASRSRFDFQTDRTGARGLLLESRYPMWRTDQPDGQQATVEYDQFGLLPIRVTNAAALTTTADYDYRVLQPRSVADANGGEQRLTFTPLGMLATSAVTGRTATEGDQARPSTRLEYAWSAYDDSPPNARQPLHVRTIRQIYRDTDVDVPTPECDETTTTVEYADGFGRPLQTRKQADPVGFGDARGAGVLTSDPTGDFAGTPRPPDVENVAVSGWQVYDNKGRVIEVFEPFFSTGWDYGASDAAAAGRKVTTSYDPLGRTLSVTMPDGAEQRVVLGVPGTIAAPDLSDPRVYEPTPWESYTYDANDNAGRTHPEASAAYRHHHDTPSSVRIDARERVVERIARNREAPTAAGDPLPAIEELRTRTAYDNRGNVVEIVDALGRSTVRNAHDLANRALRVLSIDAGLRSTVYDAGAAPVEQRDGSGALIAAGIRPAQSPDPDVGPRWRPRARHARRADGVRRRGNPRSGGGRARAAAGRILSRPALALVGRRRVAHVRSLRLRRRGARETSPCRGRFPAREPGGAIPRGLERAVRDAARRRRLRYRHPL